jgi:ethanolamine ammonia-lyase small subunit
LAVTDLTTRDAWVALRRFTPARVALGRVGNSQRTADVLSFGLDHARARDAVHQPLDTAALAAAIEALALPTMVVKSAASDRREYLLRPDLGRQLDAESTQRLGAAPVQGCDVLFVIGDGLSSFAPARHAAPLLAAVMPMLTRWRIGPVVIATQARVALADDVGELLSAQLVVMLIGERPGLSSADSLGAYLTFAPRSGRNDAERNCISNIRPEGLSYTVAAHKLVYLLSQAMKRQLTGVNLKDDSDETALPPSLRLDRRGP